MPVTLRWDGLDAFKADLKKLPDNVTTEADPIVQRSAKEAAAEIKAAYPVRTGTLRNRVFVSRVDKGKHFAGAIVKNTAPHAHLYELGTQARHTDIGANRGSMPAGHVFVPRIIRHRRAMYVKLKALLVKYGAVVSGDA